MRRVPLLLTMVLLLFLVASYAQSPSTFKWDYETANDPLCSASRLDDCVKEFELEYAVGTNVVVATVVPASACVPPATGTVFVCTAPIPNVNKYASASWTVRAVGISSGSRQESVNSNALVLPGRRPTPPAGLRSQ